MPDLTRRKLMRALAAAPALASLSGYAQARRQTRNVFLVMTDGLRWQEVFGGADERLINKENGVSDPDSLRRDYWRDTPAARREALMPFLWSTIGQKGQIFGNRAAGSEVSVSNGLNFSYPGYNETLCGFSDPRIDSNDKIVNPNITVFEWLHQKPEFRGRVAAFGAWDVFPFIFNVKRAGFPVNAGYDPLTTPPLSPRLEFLNQLKSESKVWDDEAFDTFTFHTALEYMKAHTPRVLFLGLGETDEWAHDGKYAAYLHSAHRVDQALAQLWNTAQSMVEYRDRHYTDLHLRSRPGRQRGRMAESRPKDSRLERHLDGVSRSRHARIARKAGHGSDSAESSRGHSRSLSRRRLFGGDAEGRAPIGDVLGR